MPAEDEKVFVSEDKICMSPATPCNKILSIQEIEQFTYVLRTLELSLS